MDLFQPTFGVTESYKTLRSVVDTAVLGTKYLSKFITKIKDSNKEVTDLAFSNVDEALKTNIGFIKLLSIFDNVSDVITENNETNANVFNV